MINSVQLKHLRRGQSLYDINLNKYRFVAVILLLIILYPFANLIKPLQKWYCKIGWHCHQKDCIYESFDGASCHCKCKWCGYRGMVDSQGNLF